MKHSYIYNCIKSNDLYAVQDYVYNSTNIECVLADGSTLLTCAVDLGYKDIIEFLLSHKANPNAMLKTGWRPLFTCAIKNDYAPIADLLITNGAIVNVTLLADRLKAFPIHFAAAYNNADVIYSFLGAGADPNCVNMLGHTPAYVAHMKKALLAETTLKRYGGHL